MEDLPWVIYHFKLMNSKNTVKVYMLFIQNVIFGQNTFGPCPFLTKPIYIWGDPFVYLCFASKILYKYSILVVIYI